MDERVAIYARVSTDAQAERQTIDNQLVARREYCSIVRRETSPTASSSIDREAFSRDLEGGTSTLRATERNSVMSTTANNRKVRVALYVRVSGDEQTIGRNIEQQVEELTNSISPDHQVVGIYRDDGVSGATPFAERPEGSRLMTDAQAGRFEKVISTRLDRIGRRVVDISAASRAARCYTHIPTIDGERKADPKSELAHLIRTDPWREEGLIEMRIPPPSMARRSDRR